MTNTVIKEVTNPVAGQDNSHSGGTDWNEMAQVLKGTHATERVLSSSIEKDSVTVTAASVTLTASQEYVLADCTNNPITITLPSANGNLQGHHLIKKIDVQLNNLLTIQGTGGQTIDGLSSVVVRERDRSVEVYSDGSNWRLAQRTGPLLQDFHVKGATQNRFYSSELLNNTASTTATVAAGTLYAMPLIITKTTTISAVAINVTTGGASSAAEAGIYLDNGNMYPGALVADFGSKPTTSTGVQTYTTNLPLTLLPGLYWLVVVVSATAPVLSGWTATQCLPLLGTSSTLTGAWGLGWSVSQAYGALPSTFPGSGSILSAAPLPAIFWQTSQ